MISVMKVCDWIREGKYNRESIYLAAKQPFQEKEYMDMIYKEQDLFRKDIYSLLCSELGINLTDRQFNHIFDYVFVRYSKYGRMRIVTELDEVIVLLKGVMYD